MDYEALLLNLPGMVYRCKNDPDWTMEYVSPGCKELTGYDPEELIGNKKLTYIDIIHPDDRDMVWNRVQEMNRMGKLFEFEYRIIDSDKKIKWVNERGVCVEYHEGEAKYLEGFIYDVTEKKQIERELITIYNDSKIFRGVLSTDGKMINVNKSALDFIGSDLSDIVGTYFWETPWWTHSSSLQKRLKDCINKVMKGINDGFEAWHIGENGETRHVNFSLKPIWDKEGNINRLLAEGVDITALKKAETALQKSELNLKTLVNTIPDMIWLKDQKGVYITCNPRFEDFFGASEEEIAGKTDYDFVEKDLADFFRQKDKEAIAAGGPTMNEEEVTMANSGEKVMLETIKTPISDLNGKAIGVLGVARDITRRKEVELELQNHRLHLEELITARTNDLKEKNEFLQRMNDAMVDRELRFEELHKEIENLKSELGKK